MHRPRDWYTHCLLLVLCFAAALLSLVSLSAQDIAIPGKKNPLASENAQRGMNQFQQSCAMCHGSEAKGGSGPNLIDSSLVRHDENGNLIGKVIRDGRLERGMPSFSSFSDAQVADLVAFLHAMVEASDNRSAGGPARGYSLKQLLTGNVEAGKQFFNGEGKCASCHSPVKDLAGVAKKYSPLELIARILYPPDQSQTGVVSLPSGEKVKGKILHLDAFYVAILDANGQYRSWPLEGKVKVEVEDPLEGHLKLLNIYTDKDIHDLFAYLETLQ
jgi:cytochrome c oxidase cbb3-type subunit III